MFLYPNGKRDLVMITINDKQLNTLLASSVLGFIWKRHVESKFGPRQSILELANLEPKLRITKPNLTQPYQT